MKLKHPFLCSKLIIPKDKLESVEAISSWLSFQAHLPKISDDMIMMFLHSCYYSLERAKDTIDAYYTMRARCPEFFGNWDFDRVNEMWKVAEMFPMEKPTDEGYHILIYRLHDLDAAKFNFNEMIRSFCAFNDVKLSEDATVTPGYVVILDMKGLSFGHLVKVTSCVQGIKMILIYLQECHPVRLKQVHIINTVPFMDKILNLVKPFIQSDLMSILHLHSNVETLSEYFPLDLLSEEYGGKQTNGRILHNDFNKIIEARYKSWLKESAKLIANEKNRVGKPRKNLTGCELEGSFRKLELD